MLTQEQLTGIFTRLRSFRNHLFSVRKRAGCIACDGYRVISINHKKYKEQRLAWLYMTGKWPEIQIDHINMIKDDNRWINLRLATSSHQQANRTFKNKSSSGYRGVFWIEKTKRWGAHIRINGKLIYLGSFFAKEEAYSV